jgi:predicted MPP superfamily phosphohydrolase
MWFIWLILGLMLALDLGWWWYSDRLLRPLRYARLWRGLVAVFMATQVFMIFWTLAARRFGPGFDQLTPKTLISATYLWHLIALPAVLAIWIAAGVVTMPWRLARWVRREHVEHPRHHITGAEAAGAAADLALEPQTCVAPSRRQFLGGAIAAAPPLLTAGTVGFASLTLNDFRVRRIDLWLPTLPNALDGLSIAHVTDVHVGRFTEGPQLRRIAEATNKLGADLVLLTGDLINNSLSDLPAALDGVKRIDARAGVYMCEGNHDLFDGVGAFRRRVKDAGVSLLVGESDVVTINGHPVQLLGAAWARGATARPPGSYDEVLAANLPPLLAHRRPDAFPILLAHHPHAFDFAAEAGIPLTLAGHTHGGQLMLSRRVGFGPLMYRYWSGLYRRNDSALVVSNGVGNWFPLRVGAPAEIVHITLRRQA